MSHPFITSLLWRHQLQYITNVRKMAATTGQLSGHSILLVSASVNKSCMSFHYDGSLPHEFGHFDHRSRIIPLDGTAYHYRWPQSIMTATSRLRRTFCTNVTSLIWKNDHKHPITVTNRSRGIIHPGPPLTVTNRNRGIIHPGPPLLLLPSHRTLLHRWQGRVD